MELRGIWLRKNGEHAEVLAEINGEWRLLIAEHIEGPFSHVIEPAGMAKAPIDPLTGGK